MVRLEEEQYGVIGDLTRGFGHQLVVPSILAGLAPARVWVDSASSPEVAVVWDLVNGLIFCSSSRTDAATSRRLTEFLRDELVPQTEAEGYVPFQLEALPVSMIADVRDALSDKAPADESLLFYSRSPDEGEVAVSPSPEVARSFEVVRLTRDLLLSDLENADEVRMCVDACWRDRELYLENGIGHCAVQDGVLSAWCSTDYLIHGAADLYVETFEPYGRKGLGTWVAACCVNACLQSGFAVHWHCWSHNTGSRSVAERSGLSLLGSSPALQIGTASDSGTDGE